MQRTFDYCDICNKQISYEDSDSDRYVEGVALKHREYVRDDRDRTKEVDKPLNLYLSLHKRTPHGSSGGSVNKCVEQVCSPACLVRYFQEIIAQVEEKWGDDIDD